MEETASNSTVLKHQDEKLEGSGHGRESGHRNVKETAVGTVWEMGEFEQTEGQVARKVGCNWIPVALGLVHSFTLKKGADPETWGRFEGSEELDFHRLSLGSPQSPRVSGKPREIPTLRGTKTVKPKVPFESAGQLPILQMRKLRLRQQESHRVQDYTTGKWVSWLGLPLRVPTVTLASS